MKKKVLTILLAGMLCFAPQTVSADEENAQIKDTEQPEDSAQTEDRVAYYNIVENGGSFETDENGDYHYILDGKLIKNAFFCDGTYTYYLQNDGTPMKDRLTYHPDGEHIIYFDSSGHECFDVPAHIYVDIAGNPVDDVCYFDSSGYLTIDRRDFEVDGTPYYYNSYGVRQKDGWFQFTDGNYGYAGAKGDLVHNTFGYNSCGQKVFYHWDGTVARGLIADEFYYYEMDESDGHLIGAFSKDTGDIAAWEPAQDSMIPVAGYDMYLLGDNCVTREAPDHSFLTYMKNKHDPRDNLQLWIYQTKDGGISNSETHDEDVFVTNRGITVGATREDVVKAYGQENEFVSGECQNGEFPGWQLMLEGLADREPEVTEQLKKAVYCSGYMTDLLYQDVAYKDEFNLWYMLPVYRGIHFYYDENGKVILIEYFERHGASNHETYWGR